MLKGVNCQNIGLGVYVYMHIHIYTNTIIQDRHIYIYTHTHPPLSGSWHLLQQKPYFCKKKKIYICILRIRIQCSDPIS